MPYEKITRFAGKKYFWVVSNAIGYHLGPVPPSRADVGTSALRCLLWNKRFMSCCAIAALGGSKMQAPTPLLAMRLLQP